jgi:hypothetical protein
MRKFLAAVLFLLPVFVFSQIKKAPEKNDGEGPGRS